MHSGDIIEVRDRLFGHIIVVGIVDRIEEKTLTSFNIIFSKAIVGGKYFRENYKFLFLEHTIRNTYSADHKFRKLTMDEYLEYLGKL